MKKRSKHHHRTSTFEQEMREFSGSLFMRQFAAAAREGEAARDGFIHFLSPASQQDLQLKMRALSLFSRRVPRCAHLHISRLVLNSVAAAEAAGGGVTFLAKNSFFPLRRPFA
jgi:hypothetical protein